MFPEYDLKLLNYEGAAFVAIYSGSCVDDPLPASGFKIGGSYSAKNPDQIDQLATCISKEYQTATGLPFTYEVINAESASYHIFRDVSGNTPAVRLEMGSLKTDRKILVDQADKTADGIVAGIICYLKGQAVPINEQVPFCVPAGARFGQEISRMPWFVSSLLLAGLFLFFHSGITAAAAQESNAVAPVHLQAQTTPVPTAARQRNRAVADPQPDARQVLRRLFCPFLGHSGGSRAGQHLLDRGGPEHTNFKPYRGDQIINTFLISSGTMLSRRSQHLSYLAQIQPIYHARPRL
jgi:hypothetical protein